MKLRRSAGPLPALIFFAPALNLGIILIFFLLLGSGFLVQPGVAVSVPSSPFLLSPQRSPRVISITAPPLAAIYFDNEEVQISDLRAKLRQIRGRSQTIIIKADKKALYETVSAVVNTALELGFPVALAASQGENL